MVATDLGRKDDTGKADLSLLSWYAMEQEALVFMFGAVKYGRGNYRKGLSSARILAAAGRHLWSLLRGEELDPESGLPHWAHVRCCMQMYADCQRLGTLREDRLLDPVGKPTAQEVAQLTQGIPNHPKSQPYTDLTSVPEGVYRG